MDIINMLQSSDFTTLIPELFLGAIAFIMLFLGIKYKNPKLYSAMAFISLLIAIGLLLVFDSSVSQTYSGILQINDFGLFFAIIMIISSLYMVLPSTREVHEKPELFYATLLFVNIAMIIAAFSFNLIVIFIAFEGVSIGTYIMTAYGKSRRNLEAATKYFFTGTIATSFILFGSAFFYIAAGTFNLQNVAALQSHSVLIALIFLFVGFGFKLALVPMHQWAIDAYDGSPNSVSAFLSTGTKVLAFLIILRIFLVGFSLESVDVYYLFIIISIITMTYGNIAAISETNLKRVFAYSSVAQAGYLILVLAVVGYNYSANANDLAILAGMYYSLVYIFMKGGAFFSVGLVKKENAKIDDLSGLAWKSPAMAISIIVILISLAGVPPTAGFFAKYYLFLSLISGQLWWLAVIAIVNSAISVFYYLRLIVIMFRRDGDNQFDLSPSVYYPVAIAAIMMFALVALIYEFPTIQTYVLGMFGV
ncbi:MAG: NADH-quinone oxidoreductase subunit NuoN [Thermoplasmataceae archaeon]